MTSVEDDGIWVEVWGVRGRGESKWRMEKVEMSRKNTVSKCWELSQAKAVLLAEKLGVRREILIWLDIRYRFPNLMLL